MVFENRILRLIFGPRIDEFWGWRRPHYEELYSLYGRSNTVTLIKCRRLMGKACSQNERRNECFKNFNK